MSGFAEIRIARVYDDLDETAGARILVDRVWPGGVWKDSRGHDDCIPQVSPSTGLLKWFGHDPDKWDEFRRRYRAELEENPLAVARCLAWCRNGPVTLLYSAKDRDHNQAVVLRDHLRDRMDRKGTA